MMTGKQKKTIANLSWWTALAAIIIALVINDTSSDAFMFFSVIGLLCMMGTIVTYFSIHDDKFNQKTSHKSFENKK